MGVARGGWERCASEGQSENVISRGQSIPLFLILWMREGQAYAWGLQAKIK